MKLFDNSIFIFRRDLRLNDNTALIEALKLSKIVIPCFIFDPRQVDDENKYKSNNAIQFMIESLNDLQSQLKNKGLLNLFYGKNQKIIEEIFNKKNIDALFVNSDYTPFSLERDLSIQNICTKYNVVFKSYFDLLLTEPKEIVTSNGTPYKIFTAFFQKAVKKHIPDTIKNKHTNYYDKQIDVESSKNFINTIPINKNSWLKGGTTNCKNILKSLTKFENYRIEKNFPAKDTTYLSAHLKFGTCSIREIYHAIKKQLSPNHPLIRQLFWRDFFTHVAYNWPYVFGSAFKKKYNKLKWDHDSHLFNLWCKGKTGFPIVDAGMRQLNETGFMHNRVRMIVASFLVKNLHMNWQLGEKYFATKLIDYDPSVNNGNWQWVASTGCDSQPYFRIFNPWIQQKKFDQQCIYIKTWVPELKNLEPKKIHSLYLQTINIQDYPKSIIDYSKESKVAITLYKNIK